MKVLFFAIFGFLVHLSGQSPQQTANRGQNSNQPRISAQKCEEYKDLIPHENDTRFVGSMWDVNNPEYYITTKKYNCDEFTGLIIGGVKAKTGEFPHAAALGWKNSNQNVEFKCGGSLISENFVLTVAHCATDNNNPPSIVRLGDQNLASVLDGAEPEDYDIKRFIKHEDYEPFSRMNDIGLIELKTNVKFSKFIRPACLEQFNRHPGNVTAIGWGKVGSYEQTSNELLKVELKVVPMRSCNDTYEGDLFKSQFCAGGVVGKDTCNGDSGGAIQVFHSGLSCFYKIVGLTSYGSYKCGSRSPSIYTRVYSYLDWIEQKVWPKINR